MNIFQYLEVMSMKISLGMLNFTLSYLSKIKLFFLFVFPLIFQNDARAALVVLMYHNIGSRPITTSTTIDNFERQLQIISENNITVLSESALEVLVNDSYDFSNGKYILITFDDGWGSQKNAMDALSRYNMPAIFFINGSQIKNKHGGYLSLSEIKSLQRKDMFSFEDHSYTHDPRLHKGLNLEADYQGNLNFFVNNLGFKPIHYALPFGLNSNIYEKFLRDNGSVFIYGVHHGIITESKRLKTNIIPRYDINNSITDDKFKKIINGLDIKHNDKKIRQ